MPDASGVRMDQAAASWTNLLLVLLIAGAVVGGSVLLAGFQSLLDHVQITEEAVLVGSSWHGNHSGWSRPLFPDHCDLASLEYEQLEAARLRSGWRVIS